MLIVMNCQTFWPKSRDFVSLSLRTCHKFILTMGLSDLGFSSVVIWYKAWLVTYTQVGVLYVVLTRCSFPAERGCASWILRDAEDME